MLPLYTTTALRAIEHAAAAALPQGELMRRAGLAGADAARALLPRQGPDAAVLVLAGPGNNGGDALELAAHLADAGLPVTLWLLDSTEAAEQRSSPERRAALERARRSACCFIDNLPAVAEDSAAHWALVVDGLFGIGLTRPLGGAARQAAEMLHLLDCPILALDVPSGLDADTGAVIGPGGVAVRATRTITFIGDKPGLHTCDGRDYAGQVEVASLGIAPDLFPPAGAHLNAIGYFARHPQARRHNSHKGSYGNVAVLGGAHGMAGAPVLAARAALLCGAGRVFIAFPDEVPAYDSAYPELMCRQGAGFDFDSATLVAGPGLGASHHAQDLLRQAIDSASALLLDADALNLLAAEPELQAALAQRGKISILTPHPLEAARLLGIGVAEVQADRLAAARQLATQLAATVILKGSGTVVAGFDGRVVINTTGNPALATAGSGDVLSGLCGSLLAQGWPEWEAALAAVWLHGMAADTLVANGVGPIGLTAGELAPAIRIELNRLAPRAARQLGLLR